MKSITFDSQVTEIVIVCTFKVPIHEYRNPSYALISVLEEQLGRTQRQQKNQSEFHIPYWNISDFCSLMTELNSLPNNCLVLI